MELITKNNKENKQKITGRDIIKIIKDNSNKK